MNTGVSAKELGLEGLAVEDKLALIDELWEGIVAAEVTVPISDELANGIERRLARYRADPTTSRSAEKVRRAGYAAADRSLPVELGEKKAEAAARAP